MALGLAACSNDKRSDPAEGADSPGKSGESGESGADAAFPDGLEISDPIAGWRWVALPETTCMNGSSTGIAYQVPRDVEGRPLSNNLIVYFQGGNACVNAGCMELFVKSMFGEEDWEAALCKRLKDGDACEPDTDSTFP